MINIIALLVALVLSGVAAWYSIIGLTAIFAAAFWPVVIMGTALEVGKVVTASWLYRNWDIAPKVVKYYLTTAVIILMFITSMGIFGFLSKAHIEQTAAVSDNTVLIQQIDSRIERENKKISDAEIVIQQLDNAVKVLQDANRMRGKDGAIAVREKQKEERASIQATIDSALKEIDKLQSEKTTLSVEQAKIEAEVGPLKYIAELVYTNADKNQLENAVRWVIIILVMVFDPLAVLLLIAANIGLQNKRTVVKQSIPEPVPAKRGRGRPRKTGVIEIDENSIVKL